MNLTLFWQGGLKTRWISYSNIFKQLLKQMVQYFLTSIFMFNHDFKRCQFCPLAKVVGNKKNKKADLTQKSAFKAVSTLKADLA